MSSASPLEAPLVSHKRMRYQQIDVIKGLATVSVILLHALEYEALLQTFAIFHIWQAVPLFMILMGLNLGLSPAGTQTPLLQLYLSKGFRKRIKRLLMPVLLMYLVSIGVGFIWHSITGKNPVTYKWLNLLGMFPVTGPGNYFVTLVWQSLLLLPLIGYFYKRKPGVTIVLLVVLEVGFLLLCEGLTFSKEYDYLYSAAFIRYFSAVAFGLALSQVVSEPTKPKIWFLLLILALASVCFLYHIQYQLSDFTLVRKEWQAQCVLAFGYAALLVVLLFRIFPVVSANRGLLLTAAIGKASYHIFLVQILYFGLAAQNYSPIQALAVCLPLGYLFYLIDSKYF
ncbi:acyltransferase family protein [Pontibacter sp. 13R65]|uniref:acyltransferase family protein n=1 Tax=Pontibacter sp. 13R65 TaxID=3127458 RepID=UPI00301DEDC5